MDLRSREVASGLVALFVVAPSLVLLLTAGCGGTNDAGGPSSGAAAASGDQALAQAFAARTTDLEVEGVGTVMRLLADDEEGSRHQRFILRLESGQTLLVAHNIDLAPRIDGLEVGDAVAFRGEYEWSSRGGTIHWTHRDPDGDHAGGWLRHDGTTYR
jgi:hypothetical protein